MLARFFGSWFLVVSWGLSVAVLLWCLFCWTSWGSGGCGWVGVVTHLLADCFRFNVFLAILGCADLGWGLSRMAEGELADALVAAIVIA